MPHKMPEQPDGSSQGRPMTYALVPVRALGSPSGWRLIRNLAAILAVMIVSTALLGWMTPAVSRSLLSLLWTAASTMGGWLLARWHITQHVQGLVGMVPVEPEQKEEQDT